jgi:hypothetical protein
MLKACNPSKILLLGLCSPLRCMYNSGRCRFVILLVVNWSSRRQHFFIGERL